MAESDDLWTSIVSRYSTVVLRALTNPQAPSATSIVTATGVLAAVDVIADFAAHGITYDNDDSRHLAVAEHGVIAKLQSRTGQYEWAWKRHEEYQERLERLRMVTANDRMSPLTNSVLDPEAEVTDEKPDMDPSRFGDILPGAP